MKKNNVEIINGLDCLLGRSEVETNLLLDNLKAWVQHYNANPKEWKPTAFYYENDGKADYKPGLGIQERQSDFKRAEYSLGDITNIAGVQWGDTLGTCKIITEDYFKVKLAVEQLNSYRQCKIRDFFVNDEIVKRFYYTEQLKRPTLTDYFQYKIDQFFGIKVVDYFGHKIALNKDFKFIATDSDGFVYGYYARPFAVENFWMALDGDYAHEAIYELDLEDSDWRLTLLEL